MTDPVKLSHNLGGGEILLEDGRGNDKQLCNSVGLLGTHRFCFGGVKLIEVSETNYAVSCMVCNLRIIVPKSCETITGLRRYLENYNPRLGRPKRSA